MGMLPHKLRYHHVCECTPMYWGTPVYRDAFPHTGVPQYLGMQADQHVMQADQHVMMPCLAESDGISYMLHEIDTLILYT